MALNPSYDVVELTTATAMNNVLFNSYGNSLQYFKDWRDDADTLVAFTDSDNTRFLNDVLMGADGSEWLQLDESASRLGLGLSGVAPAVRFDMQGDRARFRNNATYGAYLDIYPNDNNEARIIQQASAGQSKISLVPTPFDTSSASSVHLFENVDTSAAIAMKLFDNATEVHRLRVNGDSWIDTSVGDFIFGGTAAVGGKTQPLQVLSTAYFDAAAEFGAAVTFGGAVTLGSTISATGSIASSSNVTVDVDGSEAVVRIKSDNQQYAGMKLFTDDAIRWHIAKSDDNEAGSDAGSDFVIRRYDDSEVLAGTAVTISRATGLVTMHNGFSIGDDSWVNAVGDDGDMFLNFATDEGRNTGLALYKDGVAAADLRWIIKMDDAAESGSNAGSHLDIVRHTDGGAAFEDRVFRIRRDNGEVVVEQNLRVKGRILATSPITFDDDIIIDKVGDAADTVLTLQTDLATRAGVYAKRGSGTGDTRWFWGMTTDAESGLDAGSKWELISYGDGGDAEENAASISVARDNGLVTIDRLAITTQVDLNGVSANFTNSAAMSITDGEFTTDDTNVLFKWDTGDGRVLMQSGSDDNMHITFGHLVGATDHRWSIGKDDTVEAGSNTGADFEMLRHNDSGVVIDAPFKVIRSSGQVQLTDGYVSGKLGVKDSTPTYDLDITGTFGVSSTSYFGGEPEFADGFTVSSGYSTFEDRVIINDERLEVVDVTNSQNLLKVNPNSGSPYVQMVIHSSAPGWAHVQPSTMVPWFDETNDQLEFRLKDSAGNKFTLSLNLTAV